VKNLALCFDRTADWLSPHHGTNATALFSLLDHAHPDTQVTWYGAGSGSSLHWLTDVVGLAGPTSAGQRLRWRETAFEGARASVLHAYSFLADRWEPGDAIFIFGVGRGGHCALCLARLLGTVGIPDCSHDVMDYAVATYSLPRTGRTAEDWQRVGRLVSRLVRRRDIAVPVQFLGLWDTTRVPGSPGPSTPELLPNVAAGRHAVAIDGGRGLLGECLIAGPDPAETEGRIDEVWFRGTHCDVAGGPAAHWPLVDISLDWIVDGAVKAGAVLGAGRQRQTRAPNELDALAETAPTIPLRTLPANAVVHASVELYLRSHPWYWRRLPAHVVWADPDWVARGERLIETEGRITQTLDPEPTVAVPS
jgi:uncharacterized protein (DUF2235 family)